jgi:hypothetical protein
MESMLYRREDPMAPASFPRRAVFFISLGQWNYWVMLAVAARSYKYVPGGSIRNTLILTPVLPALVIVPLAYWLYQACDEFIRLRLLKCVVITAIAVAIFTLGYFFLELYGFPRLNMLAANLFGWSVFNLQMVYVIIRSR